ncbi:MAG: TRC40/GET3/ArsA family transport-energizing ATPase [Firmicutes bacterium]|nr:TRC40/GET3/ArsA family transport-energizing ATPase [Bacillota bacterium]
MSAVEFKFFSGKGGVGKTSMACTTAVRSADEGRQTLIVTTDPASNLADVFEQPIGHKITPIEGVTNLWAMEIDPDRATHEYKERALAPIREIFPPEVVRVMEEQMSSPCTAEVAAFDRFTDFIDTAGEDGQSFGLVIFDTAPTGHTLRLLELPAEWSRSIQEAAGGSGQTCIGPAAAIQEHKAKYERALAAMRDQESTTFTFVLHPEATAIKETKRAIVELSKLGVRAYQLIINGIIPPGEAANDFFAERIRMQQGYVDRIARELPFPARRMFLLDGEIKGASRLRHVGEMLFDGLTDRGRRRPASVKAETAGEGSLKAQVRGDSRRSSTPGILARITPDCHRRTLFFAGKGGVGKTAVSCITAVWLARQGYRTLLLTTDPAEHIGDVLEVPVSDEPARVGRVPQLWVTKIDAKAAAEAYKDRILDDARKRGRPQEALESMAEELNSPCTEEMAAFDKFIDYASQEGWDVVVFDTAPTGHTLRLLELPIDWSAQLDVKIFASVDASAADDVAKRRFGEVIEMMRDPGRSTFAFVMYPESTPIVESYRAAQELRTVGIEPGLVVANQVLPPEVCTTPYARARRSMQEKYLAEIGERFGAPVLTVPLLPHEVRGLDVLVELGERLYGDRVAARRS